MRTLVTRRHLLRQRARLLRHEHALRDDHEVALVQQRHGHRPERAEHSEKFAPPEYNDHHRQRRLLEQLQLLRGRAVQGASGRTSTRRRTRSASASCCSAAAHTQIDEQPDLGQLPGRRGHDPAAAALQAAGRPEPDRQLVHQQPFGLRRRRTSTAATSSMTATARTTASPATRACRRRSRRTASTLHARARSAVPTRSQRTSRARSSDWALDETHEKLWVTHPHAAAGRASCRSSTTPPTPARRRRSETADRGGPRGRRLPGRGLSGPPSKKVQVGDDYYTPPKLTVRRARRSSGRGSPTTPTPTTSSSRTGRRASSGSSPPRRPRTTPTAAS